VIDVAAEVVELGPGVSTFKIGEKILGLLDFTVKASELLQFFIIIKFPPNLFGTKDFVVIVNLPF
jgi:hypothetical protein